MRPWRLAAMALLLAYAGAILALTYYHPAFLLGVPLAALVAAAVAWRRRARLREPGPRTVAALLAALYLLPFARLAFWNGESPLFALAGEWSAFLSQRVAGGYHPHEALPLPLYVLFLVAAMLPIPPGISDGASIDHCIGIERPPRGTPP